MLRERQLCIHFWHPVTPSLTTVGRLSRTRRARRGDGDVLGNYSDGGARDNEDLTALELQHGHANGEEQHYPRYGGYEAQVNVRFQQVPAPSQYAPQGRRRHGQRQTVTDVPQQNRHTFHRPDDT